MTALVLLYHSVTLDPLPDLAPWTVTPAQLAEHARLIAESGRPVLSVTDLVERRRAGTAPRDAIVLTFDDGYADNLEAADILSGFGLPATIYVTTSALGRTRMLTPVDLPDLAARHWEVGSHGVTHRRLDEIPRSEAVSELVDSRSRIEDWTGLACATYAYPHGSYTDALARLAAEAGYSSAAAVRDCLSTEDDHAFALGRMTVMAGLDPSGLKAWLDGTDLPESTSTPRPVTEAYRAFRRARTRLRGRARDELDARLNTLSLG